MSKKQIEILKDLKDFFEKHKAFIKTGKTDNDLDYIKIFYTEKCDCIEFPHKFLYTQDVEDKIKELEDE